MTTTGQTITRLAIRVGIGLGIGLGITALTAGCAQPGQLGAPVPPPTPEPVIAEQAAAAPAQLEAPVETPPARVRPAVLGTGLVEDRVTIRTPGPAEFSVRTEILEPGDDTGWHRHPGTEMSIVSAGAVTVLRPDDCDGTRFSAGDAVFVPDAQPHLARNDGTVPVELVVTYLLAPGAHDRQNAPDAC